MTASADLPPDPPGLIPHDMMERAAEWFALLRSGEATDTDRTEWQVWLAASPLHHEAWARVERISRRFAPIRTSDDPRAVVGVYSVAHERMARRRRLLLGVAGTGALGWALWHHTPLPGAVTARLSDHHTGVGEVREIVLADGSRLWLGSASAVDVAYGTTLRRLRLQAGEIFIQTAADGARAFVVDTPQGRLRALGTRFDVRLDSGQRTAAAVYEGAVEVRTAGAGATAVLRAGQQARFTRQALEGATAADPGRQAWTKGLLIAQDRPLGEVVAELARYRRGHLAVAPEVADLRVHGSFPLGDTDRALSMLAGILPIRVRQTLPWWSTVEPRDRTASR